MTLPITIRAAGTTGQETFELQINEQVVATFNNVGGDASAGVFETFTYNVDGIDPNSVRIVFTNDLFEPGQGIDRNLRVDNISIDGSVFESEAPSVFSTGTWLSQDGIVPGNRQSEFLHTNGYLQYSGEGESTSITVNARGTEGTESFALQIDGQTVEVFENINTNFSSHNFTASGTVTADQIRVVFLNDQYDPANGIDSNLVVDDIVVGGVQFETEASNVFSTGTFLPVDGIVDGFGRGDTLHANGYFEFSSEVVNEPPPPAEPTPPVEEPTPPVLSNGDGLFAEYFEGRNFNNLVRDGVDSNIDFNFDRGGPDGLPNDDFSIRWTGQVEALHSEQYTFETTSDDGVRLWVNDELIIDNFTNHAATIDTGTIRLEAGVRYDIRLEYYERTGRSIIQLRWSSNSQSLETIPQSQLYSSVVDEPTQPTPPVTPAPPAERVPATYFVSRDGSDNFSAGQSQDRATPWQTIQRAVDAARAGDTIVVADGTYREEIFLRHSGNAGEEIILKAENQEGVRLLGFIHGRDVSHITVDGFDITNSNEEVITQGIVFYESHHVTVSNNLVRDSFGGGIAFNQSDSILIEGNTTHGNAFLEPDAHSGISVYQPQRREGAEGEYGVIIRNNISYNNFNLIPNQNCCGRPTDGNGIVLDDYQNSQNRNGTSNGVSYDRRTLVENNIVHSNGGHGIHVFRSHLIDIRNNTSVNNVLNLRSGAQINVSSSRDVNVFNNIASAGPGENAVRASNTSRVTLQYNLVDGPRIGFSNDSTNFFNADPNFVSGTFEPRANSVAIDGGRAIDDPFSVDVLGQDRVVGRIDIGAVERQS
jgi:parallel beta-helix repeat protein